MNQKSVIVGHVIYFNVIKFYIIFTLLLSYHQNCFVNIIFKSRFLYYIINSSKYLFHFYQIFIC